MVPRRREFLILGVAGVLATGAGMLVGPWVRREDSGASALRRAEFRELGGGGTRRVSDWLGQIVVCNFWATWCAPCREEMPMLAEVRRVMAVKGVEIVGIGIDQADKMQQFSDSIGIRFPLLQGDAATLDLLKTLGNTTGGLPYTIVLDRRGAIRARHTGAYTRSELEAAIRQADAA